ncbi:hypothetical protein ACFL4U_03470 [Candidatus Neomarinimicrobiota bacterium]
MKNHPKLPLITLLVGVFVLQVETAYAIPGFARKYGMSCTTCHTMFPKLKEFGEEFAGNAFVMEGQEPRRANTDTGDELLLLQRDFPVAVRFDVFAQAQTNDDHPTADFQTPWGVKLLSGGNVTEKIAYYFYFYMSEHGEVVGVEDAYLYFSNIFGSGIGAAVGQFQVCDPLFKRELRLTYEDYQLYKVRVGYVPTNLAYDRGIMLDWGAPWGTDIFLEVVNGNGIGESEGGYYDGDNYKNVFLRASQGFGPLRLGAFGYHAVSSAEYGQDNSMLVGGPDATLSAGPLEINFQYLWRQDDNPFCVREEFVPDDPVITTGELVEIIMSPQGDRSRWNLVGLYNRVDSNIRDHWTIYMYPAFPEEYDIDYESIGLTANYLVARNLRLLAEVKYDLEAEQSRFVMGFVAAF